MELITYFYTPTPQRRGTYGDVDPLAGTPDTLEEWTEPQWVAWMTHEDPETPWLNRRLKARVQDFELVLKSRFPSLHDTKTARWGKELARLLAARRWRTGRFENPRLLRAVRRRARVRDDRQAYGHLRPPGARAGRGGGWRGERRRGRPGGPPRNGGQKSNSGVARYIAPTCPPSSRCHTTSPARVTS